MSTVKVSIAMATYNGERYLSQLLESLSNQTLRADEIVVVDDCSIDGTLNILKEYSEKLPLKIHVNESNLGVNRNFEKAASLATGDYILLCDQDDVWLPCNIEKKVQTLDRISQNEPAFVASRSIMVDAELKELISFGVDKDDDDAVNIFFTPFQGTTLAFNRKFLDIASNWPESFKEFPYDGYLRFCAVITAHLYALAEPLMLYRCHENNVELSINKKMQKYKRTWITFLLQYSITPLRLRRLDFVLKKTKKEHVLVDRLKIFEDLESCLNEDKIFWWKLLSLQSIGCKKKVKIFVCSMMSNLRKKIAV